MRKNEEKMSSWVAVVKKNSGKKVAQKKMKVLNEQLLTESTTW